MHFLKKIIFLLLISGLSVALSAQQSSKSKAKDKLYEKGGENEVIVTNVSSINTEHLEFSPAFYENGIVFISARDLQENVDHNINESFFELFYSEFTPSGEPTQAEEFSLMVNSGVHEGPVSFDKGGKTIYFTRNNVKKGKVQTDTQSKARLKVYEAKKGKFDWEKVKELPFNSNEYSIAHPALSPDGKWLFFTSDMPGGEGGMDLFKVAKNGDTWGEPINLGPSVNTPDNELFPYVHESGYLFFASNGHPGVGGLDIFQATEQNGQWRNVQNLGKPYNSPADDLGLILNPLGTKGFFTSSRGGGKGKDDIYQFEVKKGIKKSLPVLADFRVFDTQTKQLISGASIRIFGASSNGVAEPDDDLFDVVLIPSKENPKEMVMKLVKKNADDLGAPQQLTNANGQANLQLDSGRKYIVMVSGEGYEDNEFVLTTINQSGKIEVPISMTAQRCAPIAIKIQNKNNNALVPNALVKIQNDCSGELLELQTNSNGMLDHCIPPNCNVTVTVEKDGFTLGSKTFNATDPTKSYDMEISLAPIAKATVPEPIAKGTVIVLENIYYDFNKSYIRSGAAKELDELLDLMTKYPSMKIELVSHTDSRGGSRYNMQLSKKRAASAKKYLVNRGITADRIIAQGMGETQPRNHCDDWNKCTEKEYQYNRRTEVKIIAINESVRIQYGKR